MSAEGATDHDGEPRSAGGRRRSVARLGAIQALYQLALNPGLGADVVVGEFRLHRLGREIDGETYGEADEELFVDIVRGVARNREQLDQTIAASLSEEWPLRRLETILRLILEAGAYELTYRPDVPPRVTLSEYVGIAHAFFDGGEPGMANGVLNRLARALRADEL
ncbi:MAG TPA: transcription antitermination factor NusB [Stellaceae bacterium]|jgi:N utilization substance protein B|nr:transcription antitermination factor NusB [Stellaceae bacterium]